MVIQTPDELRVSVGRFREMASDSGDCWMRASLLLIADELEQEAQRAEASEGDDQTETGRHELDRPLNLRSGEAL